MDRLLILLDQLYSPDIEPQFLGNLVSIFLESCCTTLDYNQKIFQYPLHACEFEEYKLSVSWRAKNIASVPKYADTIASQLHRTNILGFSEFDVKKRLQTKKTLTFQFQPTIVQTQLTDHNISTLMSYSEIIMNDTNSIGQQSWKLSTGIFLNRFLFFDICLNV